RIIKDGSYNIDQGVGVRAIARIFNFMAKFFFSRCRVRVLC
ncbi:hypothetical protein EC970007_0713, partial [Escherichia coli 97.0007]